ncbi:hypothetical protein PHYC_00487 [Phycisphaerales bacterium]|nr:hypothetical protein PHYC_00487 [Phycisphaerales bacterium]
MTDNSIIVAAQDYARRGWSVIPIRNKKKPAVKTWQSAQTFAAKPGDVAAWFERVPNVRGVGIVLGAVSGDLYVRDFDDPGAYGRWATAHADLAQALPTVKTGRGFHVYGRWHGVRTADKGDGELRGEGVYVVAPPSRNDSGAVYGWLVPLAEGLPPEIDPETAGLARSWPGESARATESIEITEKTETAETPETTEPTENTEDDEAIRRGWGEETRTKIESAIARTQPPGGGKRNYHVFKLARALKAIPALASILPRRVRVLRPLVLEWHSRARDKIITKDFAITWGDFAHAWENVRYPEGQDVMSEALLVAESAPPPVWAAEYSPECKLLASLCRELQRRAGDKPFFLSCAKAGECVGVDKGVACRWLRAFGADGVLNVVTKGTNKTGQATRFRYSEE